MQGYHTAPLDRPRRRRHDRYWRSMLRALSFRSSIVPTILPVVAAATAWSALIVSLNKSDILRWTFEDKLISMLGVALAFLLAFRTNRAFDRYWQGAQLWTTLLIQTRNLARLIWNGIQTPTREHDAEKHQMMRMLLAVAVATKCALRRGKHAGRRGSGAHNPRRGSLVTGDKGRPASQLDDEVRRLLPPGYFEVRTWRQSMVDLFDDDRATAGGQHDMAPSAARTPVPSTLSRQHSIHSTASYEVHSSRRPGIRQWRGEASNSNQPFASAVPITPRRSERIRMQQTHTTRTTVTTTKTVTATATSKAGHSTAPYAASATADQADTQRDSRRGSSPSLRQSTPLPPNLSVITHHDAQPTALQQSTNDDADSELLPHYDAIDHGSANGVTTPPLVSAQSALSITSMDSALGAHGQEPMNRFPMYDQDGSLVINTPLDIIHRIGFYIRRQRQDRLADPDDVPSMTQAINTMIDSVTKFEQILNVPLPRSYDTHMKHILLMYFLWLPFQLVRSLGWTVVLVSCVVAFAYFGADAIAAEIDGPFGTEENDLPLDHFCQKLRGDIEYIMEAPLLSSDSPTLGKFWE
ncbi:hypothetical protein HK105_206604 [Polyrhizophydium stewartii]|uniref:Uncharacterized protein n=1 Tax=Polyrhizophydium stewartii TaxID=2732419 RepID=A0ABR4N2X9_9FUNG